MLKVASCLVLIHTCHDVGTTGHADCRGVVVTVENHSVPRQLIHVRCLNLRRAIASHGIGALVICQKKDNVGTFCSTCTTDQEGQGQEKGGEGTRDRHGIQVSNVNSGCRRFVTPIVRRSLVDSMLIGKGPMESTAGQLSAQDQGGRPSPILTNHILQTTLGQHGLPWLIWRSA